MTEPTQQAAMSALSSARTAAARLDHARDPEDNAADLIEIWSGIETALRGLLHGSTLSGQELVREVRKREMLTLTQAHTLLDFMSVRSRLDDTTYKPTAGDVALAKEAVTQLEAGLTGARPTPAAPAAPAAATYTPRPPEEKPEPVPAEVQTRTFVSRVPTWAWIATAVAALAIAAAAVLFGLRGGGAGDLADARRMLREGRREAARAEFERAARENPRVAEPHLFLARMAREDGDLDGARRSAEAAVRAEPTNALALREMGTVLYVTGNYDAARRFFVRALEQNSTDATANGMLACTLVRLGSATLAERFFSRAGAGPWTNCAVQ